MINKEDGITEIVGFSCQLLWQFESLLRGRFKRRILFDSPEGAAFLIFRGKWTLMQKCKKPPMIIGTFHFRIQNFQKKSIIKGGSKRIQTRN